MIFFLKMSKLNSKQQYTEFAKYRILRSVLGVVLGLILLQFFGINGVILGFGLATLPAFAELYNYLKNKKFSMAGGTFLWWGDKILIGSIFGFSTLGSYQLASQYLLLLNTVPLALSIYLLPQESEGQTNKKIKIFSVGISIIITFISILILPYAIDNFFPGYQESIFPAQIMSLAIIPLTINSIFESRFIGNEKPIIVTIGMALQTILYFSLIIFLGINYGIIGIAIAFLVSTISRTVLYNIIIKTNRGRPKID